MQVVSLAPVPVASLTWRLGEGPWSYTVICKLTLQLGPGDAELAKRHDPIHENDRFPDDDAAASLYAPSDLVPRRKLVDVMVVGNAYAPLGQSSTSLRARLSVMSIDKRLQVVAAAEAPFKSAPLGYEYAEAGPTNPVGYANGQSARANHGHRILPDTNLALTNPGFTSPGFGPIASHWLARQSLLRGHSEPQPHELGEPCVLPADFDLGYFNAAPPDQQLPELSASAELVLEHLHPDHAILRTRLPNVAPQFFVERSEKRREEVEGAITSLWIDTRRSVATVSWQAAVALERPDEAGRVWVAVAGPGRRLSTSQLGKLIGSLSRSQNGTPIDLPEDEPTTDDGGSDPMNRTVSIRRARAPHVPVRKPGREDTLTSVLSTGNLGIGGTADNLPAHNDGFPDWVAKQPAPPTERRPRPRHVTPQPPQPPQPPSGGPKSSPPAAPRPKASAGAQHTGAAPQASSSANLAPVPGAPASPRAAPVSTPPPPPPRPTASTHLGLGPHSSAAPRPPWPPAKRDDDLADTSSLPKAEAGPPPPAPAPEPKKEEPPPLAAPPNPALPLLTPVAPPIAPPAADVGPAPSLRARAVPDEVVELLWFDEGGTARLRRRWRELCEELEFAPRDAIHDLASGDQARARAHHIHFGVLTEARLDNHEGLRLALRHAISDRGRFTPPLVLLGGSLRFPFDDVEILRATHAVVKPLAGEDKKLKAALQQVEELLATPLLSGSTDTVRNFTSMLRKRYEATQRALPLDYLSDTVERMLLEQRRYQKRLLFGAPHIRALLTVGGSDKLIPTYLPEELDKRLPMLEAMSSRIIAEAHVKQDQFEQHPYALRVVTLGRVIRVEA
jgi:hypothetical protein